jgi:Rrf2 family nitric oxide-sensitive transcriptional repressor
MRLTSFTDYSLRVLIYLASAPERRATIAEVARSFAVSENHLTKVVHFLGRAGLLANTRGRGGGLHLGLAPEEIRVAYVVRLAEMGDHPAECFAGPVHDNTCPIAKVCRLKDILAEAVDAFYATLDKYTLADLVGNRAALGRVLFADSVKRRKKAA